MLRRLIRSPKKAIVILALSVLGVIIPSITSYADPVTNWNPGYIIDDAVFTNNTTMTAGQIQAFLNSKVPVCDTNGTQTSEYGGGTRAQWGQAKYGQSTFTCLKDYTENGLNAAQIIYNTAQKYQINPQVLIVLLQKEQGLVTDTWPLNIQYRTATGYGCPDTAPCDSQYYGLTNQLDWSGKMFRAIMNRSSTWYSPYTTGVNYIRWSPTSSCGGSNVNVYNLSTAALYDYTPYQPNQAALNAGWGNGDGCSAYGNRNFFLYFSGWFGSTYITVAPGVIGDKYHSGNNAGTLGMPIMNQVCGIKYNGCFQFFQNGNAAIYWSQDTGAHTVWGGILAYWRSSGSEWGSLGLPTSDEVYTSTGSQQTFENGTVYWDSGSGKVFSVTNSMSTEYNSSAPVLKVAQTPTICGIKYDGCFQFFQNGNAAIYWSSSTNAHSIWGGILAYWRSNGSEWGSLGLPTSNEMYTSTGSQQTFENGTVYWDSGSGKVFSVTNNAMISAYNNNISILKAATTPTICGIKYNGCFQFFQNGNAAIYWSQDTGAHTVWGGILAYWRSSGSEWGSLGLPTSDEVYTSTGSQQTFENGTVYWSPSRGIYR